MSPLRQQPQGHSASQLIEMFQNIERLTTGSLEELLEMDQQQLFARDAEAGTLHEATVLALGITQKLSQRTIGKIVTKLEKKIPKIAKRLNIDISAEEFWQKSRQTKLGKLRGPIPKEDTVLAMHMINIQTRLFREALESILGKYN